MKAAIAKCPQAALNMTRLIFPTFTFISTNFPLILFIFSLHLTFISLLSSNLPFHFYTILT